MQNRTRWASLCVSGVMVMALLTGLYSTIVEPTQTSIVTATRTTESFTYSEETHVYTTTSAGVITMRTITTSFPSCSYGCDIPGYDFYPTITLVYGYEWENGPTVTWQNVCIIWNGATVNQWRYAVKSCTYELNRVFSVSPTSVTLTTTAVTGSSVLFPVTVTESHYETVPNPQKPIVQRLALMLFIIGVAGIMIAIVLLQPDRKRQALERPPLELAKPVTMPTITPSVTQQRSEVSPPTKFCRKCGARIPRDSMFCEECGAKLT